MGTHNTDLGTPGRHGEQAGIRKPPRETAKASKPPGEQDGGVRKLHRETDPTTAQDPKSL